MSQAETSDSTPVKVSRRSRSGLSAAHDHFADRLEAACEANPNVPRLGKGKLTWVQAQFSDRFNEDLSLEGIRRWFAGITAPRHRTMAQLSEILGVDEAWFALGTSNVLTQKDKKVRSASASGAVNLVAGLIQLAGGHPAFVLDDNKVGMKMKADLNAVIRGGSYFIHVALGIKVKDEWRFVVPTDAEDCVLIGVIFEGGLSFKIYELDPRRLKEARTGGSYEGSLADFAKREIAGFEDRL